MQNEYKDIPSVISRLVDGWCERRALRPLRTIVSSWPPPNGFTDEWQQVWAALRHLRAMCREDLIQHGEIETINDVIAELSRRLYPQDPPDEIEQLADELVKSIYG